MLCVLNDTGRKILAEYACGLPTLAVHGARLSQEAGGGSLWNELGVQLSRAGAMKQAVQAFRVAVESLESLVGSDSVQIASPLSNLARTLTHRRQYREALLLQLRLEQLLRGHLPPCHPRLDVAQHHVRVRAASASL